MRFSLLNKLCMLRWRTVLALFLALVGAILGTVPGWSACFAVWLAVSWLILMPMALWIASLSMAALASGRWSTARGEGLQLAAVLLLMLAMLPMALEQRWVELAIARSGLQSRAAASARSGGPRLAMTPAMGAKAADAGFVYDPDGVLSRPPQARPAAWNDDPVVTSLAGECFAVTHFAGPFYYWANACAAF
jgi:hypothetical protein